MKLDVPFYKQETNLDCGPITLKMILSFYGKEISREELIKLSYVEKSGVTWTIGLANAAQKLGFYTDFYSISIFNFENFDLDFYKQYSDGEKENINKGIFLINLAKDLGVKIYEKQIELNELLNKISNNCVPIILLNWNVVKNYNLNNYQGHFVPIVGYDEEFVYVHQSGGKTAKPYFAIQKRVFELARKSNGTDEEIVFIYR